MKILVRYNGSTEDKNALRLAKHYASVWNAKIEVVKSVEQSPRFDHQDIEEKEVKFENEIKELLDADRDLYQTHLSLTNVSPGEDIVEFAKAIEAEQIIIGIKKRSRTGKLLFGSNSQYIILNAHCPVVTIR
jgi:nucleotide-binding universal stress UspA family protein